MNKIIDEINQKRQTVKAYSDKKISQEDWDQILDTIYWSPSSHGFEPYRVLIIEKGHDLREQLKPVMWNQGVVTEADKLVFFISLDRKSFTNPDWLYTRALRKAEKVNGKTGEEAAKIAKGMAETVANKHLGIDEIDGDAWAMKQTYIALGQAMSAATILGLGSTPMEGLERAKVEKLFKANDLIKSNERVAVVAAFGHIKDKTSYAHWGTGARVRDPKEIKFTTI